MVRFLLLSSFLALFAPAAWSAAAPEPAETPRIEVVFVLDTTGSMSSLIQAAKEKTWSIASTLATTEPTPEIRLGLVGYRDRGDQYITQRTDLSDDLDAIYSKLMDFEANGGGDSPESVNQALHEAITQLDWSTDDTTYRVIYLVGDCPPHMDYEDDIKYPQSCELAVRKDIIINTIQCGNHAETMPIWKEIAQLSEGEYFQVEQSGGAIVARTPFDDQLAELSRELDATRVYYGSADIQAEQKEKLDREAEIYDSTPSSSVAKRAVFNAKAAGMVNFLGRQELVHDVTSGEVKLADIEDEELPESFRDLSPEERAAKVAELSTQRDRLRQAIQELSEKRKQYIREQVEKAPAAAANSLDAALFNSIRRQAADKDIHYAEEAQDY